MYDVNLLDPNNYHKGQSYTIPRRTPIRRNFDLNGSSRMANWTYLCEMPQLLRLAQVDGVHIPLYRLCSSNRIAYYQNLPREVLQRHVSLHDCDQYTSSVQHHTAGRKSRPASQDRTEDDNWNIFVSSISRHPMGHSLTPLYLQTS